VRDRFSFWWRALSRGVEPLDSAARVVALVVLILGVAAGITVPLVFDVSPWLTAVVLMGLFIVIILEGSYRVWRLTDQDRRAAAEQRDAAMAPQPSVALPPEPLQPRYHSRPMAAQPWITEHCIGVFNPPGLKARRVRMYLAHMDPHPRNVLNPLYEPVIPYTVPPESGGDPSAGLTLGLGQEELWVIGYTGTGGDGIPAAGGFAPREHRWYGLPWHADPDERWRLSYEIVCDGRPDVEFSIVVSPQDGHLRCDLEG
jgi:hypothetical protein